jgi:hypothetical protein
MRSTEISRPDWRLLWVGVGAFILMAITVASQAVPPPVPQSISLLLAVLLLAFTLVAVGSLAAFAWEALAADSGASVGLQAQLRALALDAREGFARLARPRA